MSSAPFDVQKQATEIQISEAIRVSDPDTADTIRRLAFERDRLRAIVDQLRKTEDGKYVIPGREYWTLHFDKPVPWRCKAIAGYGNGKLFSTREAAERARNQPNG